MAWSFTAFRGSANNKTSGALLAVSPNAIVPVGAVLVAVCLSDNVVTNGAQTNTHAIADAKANPWRKVREHTNAAAAGAGITVSVWACQITTQLLTTDNIALVLTSVATAKAIGLYQYAVAAGSSVAFIGANSSEQDATASPTATLNSLAAGRPYAFFGVCARENDDLGTYTPDADFNDRQKFGTTGGTGNTNVSAIVGDRVVAATADTFAPTALSAASDVATILIAMLEVDVTQEQLNAGKAVVLNSIFLNYPESRWPALRVAVNYLKNGTAKEQQVAKALIQQAYQAIHGIDPVGVHHFLHWLRERPLGDYPTDPTQGVGPTDAFAAETLVVN